MPIEFKTYIERITHHDSAPIDNEIVFLNLSHNYYIGLDEIGRHVWELLETSQSVEKLCNRLGQEFKTNPEKIASDLLPFLNELMDEGLIRISNA